MGEGRIDGAGGERGRQGGGEGGAKWDFEFGTGQGSEGQWEPGRGGGCTGRGEGNPRRYGDGRGAAGAAYGAAEGS